MDPIQIAIIAAVALLLVVALTVVVTRSRGRAELPPAEASPYPGDLGAESSTATATLERPAEAPAPTLERPEASTSRWTRLRARLARSGALGNALLNVLARGRLTEDDWEEIEETLLLADVGMGPTTELMTTLRREAKVLDTSDPEAVRAGRARRSDVVLVDTAGRLQNKSDLMDELGKIKRVMGREAPVREDLLVLDATTGQNGLRQAQVFSEVVDVTGIVLTKLDGTAKGGIVIAVQRELGVPVKYVGLGEGPDDLAPFDAEGFVDALLN